MCGAGFCVLLAHQLAQMFYLLVGWHAVARFFVELSLPGELDPLGDRWRSVLGAHAEVGIVGHESRLLPSLMVPGIVSSDYRPHLPPDELMEKLIATESYLAHEQLIKFVGGFQFFAFPSSSASSAGFSSFGSTSGMLKNLALSSITAT